MICVRDPTDKKQHDAYHRFVRCGRWSMDKLWQCMVVSIVLMLSIKGPLVIDIDDTLFKKAAVRYREQESFVMQYVLPSQK